MRLYIAGPMNGHPFLNYPAFDALAVELRSRGYEVASPAESDRRFVKDITGSANCHMIHGFAEGDAERFLDCLGVTREEVLDGDMEAIAEGDGVVMLPGWEDSVGATAERAAALAMGKPIYLAQMGPGGTWRVPPLPDPLGMRETIQRLFENLWNRGLTDSSVLVGEPVEPMRIIGIAGLARSGKDTAAQALEDELGFARVSLADPMREILLAMDPILQDEDPLCWSRRLSTFLSRYEGDYDLLKADKEVGPEYRRLMQRLGTEGGRRILGEDVWVNRLFKTIGDRGLKRVVVPDVRFDNEAQAIRDAGGLMVLVKRDGLNGSSMTHVSEQGVSYDLIDKVVPNIGTKDRLRDVMLDVVGHWLMAKGGVG